MFVEDVKGPAVTNLNAIYKLQKYMAHKSQENLSAKIKTPSVPFSGVDSGPAGPAGQD